MTSVPPRVTVVVATYRRPDVLAAALSSLVAQTFTDWTALVVGDGCRDGTEAVVTGVGDERLRFVDLAVNFGEQSAPNNVGIARTASPLVAFLNHDDLWFPDHLAIAVDTIDARAADLVFSPNITVHPRRTAGEALSVTVDSLSVAGRYDPTQIDRATPASSWVVRRDLLGRVGGWPAAQECVVEPSQELLFRAHRSGARLWSTGVATVVTLASGTRAGSYLAADDEHQWFLERLARPGFRAFLLSLDVTSARPPIRAPRSRRIALRVAVAAGISPRRVAYRRRLRLRAGERLQQLRERRGLDRSLGSLGASSAEIRRAEVLRSCDAVADRSVSFDIDGDGHRHTASGWSIPEIWGVWSDGPRAELAWRIDATDCCVELTLHPHADERRPSQRVVVSDATGAVLHRSVLTAGRATVAVDVRPRAGLVLLVIELPDAFTPDTADGRVLGVGLHTARVRTPTSPGPPGTVAP